MFALPRFKTKQNNLQYWYLWLLVADASRRNQQSDHFCSVRMVTSISRFELQLLKTIGTTMLNYAAISAPWAILVI